MRLNWKRVAVDAIIIFAAIFVLAGASVIILHDNGDAASVLTMIAGLTVSGYLMRANLWAHVSSVGILMYIIGTIIDVYGGDFSDISILGVAYLFGIVVAGGLAATLFSRVRH